MATVSFRISTRTVERSPFRELLTHHHPHPLSKHTPVHQPYKHPRTSPPAPPQANPPLSFPDPGTQLVSLSSWPLLSNGPHKLFIFLFLSHASFFYPFTATFLHLSSCTVSCSFRRRLCTCSHRSTNLVKHSFMLNSPTSRYRPGHHGGRLFLFPIAPIHVRPAKVSLCLNTHICCAARYLYSL